MAKKGENKTRKSSTLEIITSISAALVLGWLVLGTQAHFFSASLDMPHAVVAAEAVRVIQQVNRMYFYVPPDVEQFRIEVGTPYVAEQAKLLVWDPGGKEAASAEPFELLPAVAELNPTPEQRGKV